VLRLLVTANVVPSSPILVTQMIEALRSSETSVLIAATRRIIQEEGILHSHSREILKSCLTAVFAQCYLKINRTEPLTSALSSDNLVHGLRIPLRVITFR
jgi:hypothetical protein